MIKLESCLYNPDHNNQFNLSIKSLIINKGARVFIIGPSGSGKTTLMKALTGLLPNCEGQLYIDGDQVNNSGFPLNRKGIMFLSQDLGLWPHLTCEEHVAFVRSKGKSLKNNGEYCWLDAVGIKHKNRSRPHQLSGGEQKRLALARALAAQPQYLFLDEPFANIDPVQAQELMEMIDREQSKTKFSVIKVTHHYLGLKNSDATLLVMNQGRIVQQGTFAEIVNNPTHTWTEKWAGIVN